MPHDDCDKCEAHMAWEERLKTLDHIPTLMTFMNQELGSKKTAKILLSLFIGIPFVLLLTLVTKTQSEIEDVKVSMSQQVQAISQDTRRISQDVAVMINETRLIQNQSQKDHETIRRDMIAAVQNQINIEKNSGKK